VIPLASLISLIQKTVELKKDVELLENRSRIKNSRTINRYQNSLRSFFNYLVKAYGYPSNPMIHFPQLATDNFSNTQSLTRGEVVDLLRLVKGKYRTNQKCFRDYLIVIMLFNLALRCEECATLQWQDLDLSKQVANIYQKG